MSNRILIVELDRSLRESRSALLERQGYDVMSLETDEEALELLEKEAFDLVLLGRNSLLFGKGLDQRLREKYPHLLTLKIEVIEVIEDETGAYSTRSTLPIPSHVIRTIAEMLGI